MIGKNEKWKATLIQMAVGLLIALAFLASQGTRASAQFLPGTIECKWDHNILPYMSGSVIADDAKGWSIKICTYSYDGHKAAQLFAAPHRGASGVCSIPFIDVDLKAGPSGHPLIDDRHKNEFRANSNWTSPRIEMMEANGAKCPDPSDARYVVTRQLTEGVFSGLMALWDSLKTTPSDSASELSNIPRNHREFDSANFKRLEQIFNDRNLVAALKLNSVALDYLPPRADQRGLGFRPTFQFSFADPENRGTIFILYADWTPKGFEIVDFSVAIV
ncbi:MAG: hypothetical protein ACTHLR_05175 [Rhizomicrobium sp.]